MPEKKSCHCENVSDTKKKTIRSEEDKKQLINRLKRIEGQIRGIQQMIEDDGYCNDILQQSGAVNAAINSFNKVLLENHLKGCVTKELATGDTAIVDELVVTLQKLMK